VKVETRHFRIKTKGRWEDNKLYSGCSTEREEEEKKKLTSNMQSIWH
jgi:hypothetical protein